MRGLIVGALAVLAISLVIPPAQGSVAAREAKAPTLASMLLTVSQMPTGWAVDTASSGSGVGCLSRTLEPAAIKQTASAEVAFEDAGSLPGVDEKLATYKAPASKVFAKVVGTLDACKTISGTAGGHKLSGTLGAMSFPTYGDQSAAFLASLTIEGVAIDEAVIVVRKGTIICGIAYEALGSPDLGQAEGFVRKALARVK